MILLLAATVGATEPVELFFQEDILAQQWVQGGSARIDFTLSERTRIVAQTYVGDDPFECSAFADFHHYIEVQHHLGSVDQVTQFGGDCNYYDAELDAGQYSLITMTEGDLAATLDFTLRIRRGPPLVGPAFTTWIPSQPDAMGGGIEGRATTGNPATTQYDAQGLSMVEDVRCASMRPWTSGQWGWADDACELYMRFVCRDTVHDTWSVTSTDGPWDEGHVRCREDLGEHFAFEVAETQTAHTAASQAVVDADLTSAWVNLSSDLGDPGDETQWKSLSAEAPFLKNLVQNPDAESRNLEDWTVTEQHGTGFTAVLSDGLARFHTSSDGWNRREQLIDLRALGFTTAELDGAPPLYVSEEFADLACGGQYELSVDLLDSDHGLLESQESGVHHFVDSCSAGSLFETVQMIVEDYPTGVRFVRIKDGGMGVAMDQAAVVVGPSNLLADPASDAGWTVSGGSGFFHDPATSNVRDGRWRDAAKGWYVESGHPIRTQTLDLANLGFDSGYLDAQPPILASEMFSNEAASDAHLLKVELLDEHDQVLTHWESTGSFVEDGEMLRESVVLEDYGTGLRKIRWTDEGSADASYGLGTSLRAPYLAFLHSDRVRGRRSDTCTDSCGSQVGAHRVGSFYKPQSPQHGVHTAGTAPDVQATLAVPWSVYLMRHGEIGTDGTHLTHSARDDMAAVWGEEACPASNRAEVFYLTSTDPTHAAGNARYTQSVTSVSAGMREHCSGIRVHRTGLPVGSAEAPTSGELVELKRARSSPGVSAFEEPASRVFILSAVALEALLHGEDALLADWDSFGEVYEQTRLTHDCHDGIDDPDHSDTSFLDDYLFHAQLQAIESGAENVTTCVSEVGTGSAGQSCPDYQLASCHVPRNTGVQGDSTLSAANRAWLFPQGTSFNQLASQFGEARAVNAAGEQITAVCPVVVPDNTVYRCVALKRGHLFDAWAPLSGSWTLPGHAHGDRFVETEEQDDNEVEHGFDVNGTPVFSQAQAAANGSEVQVFFGPGPRKTTVEFSTTGIDIIEIPVTVVGVQVHGTVNATTDNARLLVEPVAGRRTGDSQVHSAKWTSKASPRVVASSTALVTLTAPQGGAALAKTRVTPEYVQLLTHDVASATWINSDTDAQVLHWEMADAPVDYRMPPLLDFETLKGWPDVGYNTDYGMGPEDTAAHVRAFTIYANDSPGIGPYFSDPTATADDRYLQFDADAMFETSLAMSVPADPVYERYLQAGDVLTRRASATWRMVLFVHYEPFLETGAMNFSWRAIAGSDDSVVKTADQGTDWKLALTPDDANVQWADNRAVHWTGVTDGSRYRNFFDEDHTANEGVRARMDASTEFHQMP